MCIRDRTEGATGSILAAIGTATPETLLPVVAILFTQSVAATDIGIGAIVGAPFMLGTLVMLLIAVTAYLLRVRRGRTTLQVDQPHASRDLGFFLVMYTAAIAIGLIGPLREAKGVLGWIFLPAYVVYVFVVLRTPRGSAADIEEEAEVQAVFDALSLAGYLRRLGARFDPHAPPAWLIVAQTLLSFGGIVLGAKVFAAWIDAFSQQLGLNALLVALLLAPLATELPEAANSLIWVKDGKDVIALGNVAGAMVLQSTVAVTFGVLLTPWVLGPFGTVAALFALLSGGLIFVQLRFRTRGDALPLSALVFGGSLYVVFILYVVRSVLPG